MENKPIAWLHEAKDRNAVIHDDVKKLWQNSWPIQVEGYTIPLYKHAQREPLSTDDACALLKEVIGIDPKLDGNLLKMLRAVEAAHGIGFAQNSPNTAQPNTGEGA